MKSLVVMVIATCFLLIIGSLEVPSLLSCTFGYLLGVLVREANMRIENK